MQITSSGSAQATSGTRTIKTGSGKVLAEAAQKNKFGTGVALLGVLALLAAAGYGVYTFIKMQQKP